MQAPPPFWAAVLFSMRSEKRRGVICPQGAQRHHKHHRRDHVRHGEVLHLGDAAARCDEQKAAAGLEVADHRRRRERIDRLGGEKQRKKHRRLRHRHERCHRAQADIGGRLTTIETLTGKVEERSPETVREYREKLTARMQEVLQSTTIDESRILTEAAIYADKIAVDEETVRLRSHVSQLRDMLLSDEPMGRKMDFLIQEVNRESNTIGSKCNDVAIARDVVALKAEVEKIREQVQNIE